MALVIAIGGLLSIEKAPTDIFPNIDIPVVSVIWNYEGLTPDDMEKRIVSNFERFVQTIVGDIDHIESQTLTGKAVVKIYLQPGASVDQCIAQTTAVAQSAARQMPSGTAKLGTNEYPILMLSTPETLDELSALPIKTVNGHTVLVRDVASVRDGNMPQTNMVHVEGRRSVLMAIMKIGDASTLDVNDAVKAAIPRALERLPNEARGHLTVKTMFDQSVFVRASINGVLR